MGLDSSLKVPSWKKLSHSLGKVAVVCLQGRLGKVIMVLLYRFRDCTSLEIPPSSFPHLGTVKTALAEALQKLCTVGRGKPYGLKHQLFKTGSLCSVSFITGKELRWVIMMNQCQFVISLWLLLIEEEAARKWTCKKNRLSDFYFLCLKVANKCRELLVSLHKTSICWNICLAS